MTDPPVAPLTVHSLARTRRQLLSATGRSLLGARALLPLLDFRLAPLIDVRRELRVLALGIEFLLRCRIGTTKSSIRYIVSVNIFL